MSAQSLLCKASTFSSEPCSELLHSNSCAQSLLWHFLLIHFSKIFEPFYFTSLFFFTLTEHLILTLIVARPDPAGSFQVRLSEFSQENILYWPFFFFFFSWNNMMCTSVSYFHPDQNVLWHLPVGISQLLYMHINAAKQTQTKWRWNQHQENLLCPDRQDDLR